MSTYNYNYITCPKGHKVFVVWNDDLKIFGFTCDHCNQSSDVAISIHGAVKVVLVNTTRKP